MSRNRTLFAALMGLSLAFGVASAASAAPETRHTEMNVRTPHQDSHFDQRGRTGVRDTHAHDRHLRALARYLESRHRHHVRHESRFDHHDSRVSGRFGR